ncbi:MAG: tRNA (adenosine(37)-N6)-threonylcarbamoyltransferase complex ATPase subunit type 1 TsaE, partial [Patescibacteria group bacterium]
MIYTTHSADQTKKIAADFSKSLKGGEFVALIGELGSGKTTFVQGLAAAFGSTAKVKSPTFTLLNIYPTTHPAIKQIVHVDYYRAPHAAIDMGLEEYHRPDTVIVVEWPRKQDLKNHPLVVR